MSQDLLHSWQQYLSVVNIFVNAQGLKMPLPAKVHPMVTRHVDIAEHLDNGYGQPREPPYFFSLFVLRHVSCCIC